MRKNLKDAFIESGKGLGRTYVGDLPSMRIDYVLYSDDFDAYNFETLNFEMSDHLPVVCNLVKQ